MNSSLDQIVFVSDSKLFLFQSSDPEEGNYAT